MAVQIDLNWRGPFHFGRSRDADLPPNESGVYVWMVPTPLGHLISYVGESQNILARTVEHFQGLLGGLYQVYDPELLRSGTSLKVIYGHKNAHSMLRDFTSEVSQAAWQNATAFDLFWAVFPSDSRSLRMAVESSILDSVIDKPEGRVVSTHRSVWSQNARKVHCTLNWPMGVHVLGLPASVEYGTL